MMRLGRVACYPVGNGEMGFNLLGPNEVAAGLPTLDHAIELVRLVVIHGRVEGYGHGEEWLIVEKAPGNLYAVRKVSRVDADTVRIHGDGWVTRLSEYSELDFVPPGTPAEVARWLAVQYFVAHEPTFTDRNKIRWDSEQDDELQRQLSSLGRSSKHRTPGDLTRAEQQRLQEHLRGVKEGCVGRRLFVVQDRYARTLSYLDAEMPVFLSAAGSILGGGPALMPEADTRRTLERLSFSWAVLGPFMTRDASSWLEEIEAL